MSLGPVMMDLSGTELSQEDKELLQHPLVGGVILFARNYHDPNQLADLTRSIRAIKSPWLLISVDQEGGKVQRFIDNFETLPPLQAMGKLYERDPQFAAQLITNAAMMMAQELLACGVDNSFAPVLDIETSQSKVIGNLRRAFDPDPATVTVLANIYIDAMNKAGMQATGKHFPGHGSVGGDSHTDILRDDRSLETIEATDLPPFINLLPKLAGVMVSHVIYSAVDAEPAGFSHFWVTEYLREKLKFRGLIFTDALDMQGAAVYESFSDRVRAALQAGCDMSLICNNRAAVIEVLDNLKLVDHPLLTSRIDALRGKFKYDWHTLHALPEWRMMTESLQKWRVSNEC